jgi:peptidyl-prolyl cis-trans isomerase B (cyclophilin B)
MGKEETMKPIRIILAVLLVAALPFLTGCGSPESETASSEPEPKAEEKKEAPPEPLTGKHVVIMETTKGDVTMELDADAAPKTVENFLRYVDRKFYDQTVIHRIRKNFMVQGGGYAIDTADINRLRRKWTRDPIPNESDNGLSNVRGSVAMARGEDPASATSQFFINVRNNRQLNRDRPKSDGHGYCVFGKVLEGMNVIDSMSRVKTTEKGSHKYYPAVPIFIKKIRRAPAETAAEEVSGG